MPKKRSTKKPDTGKPSKTKLYELDDVDHALLRHIMEYPEATFEALGKVVSLSKASVYQRYKKPAFQKALADMRAETWEVIKKGQNQAARTLIKLMRSKDDKIALDAAKTLLAPILNKGELTVHQVQEVIHRTRFGEGGQMERDTVTIPVKTESTLDLLEGVLSEDPKVSDTDDSATVPSGPE